MTKQQRYHTSVLSVNRVQFGKELTKCDIIREMRQSFDAKCKLFLQQNRHLEANKPPVGHTITLHFYLFFNTQFESYHLNIIIMQTICKRYFAIPGIEMAQFRRDDTNKPNYSRSLV